MQYYSNGENADFWKKSKANNEVGLEIGTSLLAYERFIQLSDNSRGKLFLNLMVRASNLLYSLPEERWGTGQDGSGP